MLRGDSVTLAVVCLVQGIFRYIIQSKINPLAADSIKLNKIHLVDELIKNYYRISFKAYLRLL
jgi:hypothetical protein